MSRIFGAVAQNGYVVRDVRHRGAESHPEVSIALANSGGGRLGRQRSRAKALRHV